MRAAIGSWYRADGLCSGRPDWITNRFGMGVFWARSRPRTV